MVEPELESQGLGAVKKTITNLEVNEGIEGIEGIEGWEEEGQEVFGGSQRNI